MKLFNSMPTKCKRVFILFNYLIILIFSWPVYSAETWQLSEKIKDGDAYQNIILSGAVKIKPSSDENKKAREMSGIAWDNDEEILYGISDDGYIVHMELSISEDNILKDIEILTTYRLKDESGNDRKELDADAEGITLDNANNKIKGDTILNLVLDKPARAERFSNTGNFIGSLELPAKLNELSLNQSFEINAVAGNSDSGYIFLTKERVADKNHLVFMNSDEGHEIALDNNESINIVGADYLEDDGLYILDRNYISIWQPIIYCIRYINKNMNIKDIACFNRKDGWNLDNFETITHYKDKYFLIMSDDGESFFQKTLLVMIKINDHE
jgi:hypothetical protein